jgi:phosphatidylethanolamine/phosphatidyl-N-methylethanolamine N-methyltransferase
MKTITRTDVVKTYDLYAPLYDRLFGAVLSPGRKRMAEVVSNLGAGPASLLEIGVGTGLTLPWYPEHIEITGLDLSESMLNHARQRLNGLPQKKVSLYLMDAENMAFPDHSFDCVTVPYVLSVTPDPGRLVAELRRVCKIGGRILILNHFSGSRFWWLLERAVKPLADKVGFRSDFCIHKHVLAHDWQVESITTVNVLGLSKLVVIRNESSTSKHDRT